MQRVRRGVSGVAALVACLATACTRPLPSGLTTEHSAVALTGGRNASMIYVARTADGVLAIDLGWWGHEDALRRALGELQASPADVRWVFLTHSHRDHLGAWRMVRHARFHVAEAERPRLFGAEAHGGWIAKWADRLLPPALPAAGAIDVHTFSGDTLFVVGRDTLRAYVLPGHTPGTVAYLFRGVLFLGDAVTWSRRGGFAPAKRGFSDDMRAAAASLAGLWERLPAGRVRQVCSAHAHCAAYGEAFLRDVGGLSEGGDRGADY